jgi:hypothetical protein
MTAYTTGGAAVMTYQKVIDLNEGKAHLSLGELLNFLGVHLLLVTEIVEVVVFEFGVELGEFKAMDIECPRWLRHRSRVRGLFTSIPRSCSRRRGSGRRRASRNQRLGRT